MTLGDTEDKMSKAVKERMIAMTNLMTANYWHISPLICSWQDLQHLTFYDHMSPYLTIRIELYYLCKDIPTKNHPELYDVNSSKKVQQF